MATTTRIGDFLGRSLVNLTPGTSAARDFLGRNVVASDKDFAGRSLTVTRTFPPPLWVGGAAYSTVGTRVRVVKTAEVQTLTPSGASGGTFKVRFDGSAYTAALAQNVDGPTTFQTAFVGLATVGAGKATITGTGPWVVTFALALSGLLLPLIDVDYSLLTPAGASISVARTTPGGFAVLEVATAGTAHASTMPSVSGKNVGDPITDNTVTWKRIA